MGVDRHDYLTGLLDRRGFEEHLREAAENASSDETAWVLLADLDRLRELNERHGHLEGDGYLAAVAGALRGVLAPSHRPARLGGDEFGAILRDMSMADAETLGEAVRSAVETLDHPLRGTVTVGIAGWLPASEASEGALRRADTALYRAKLQGGNLVGVSGTERGPGEPPWPRSES
jgi:diguanylate cyclase (GGDEF)-like protein